MADVSFDGQRFTLQADDGTAYLLLDAGDQFQNASDRAMQHEQYDGFGHPTGREAPLLPQIVAAVQHLSGAEAGEDAVIGLLVAAHLLRVPCATRVLYLGATTASGLLAFLAELLPAIVRDGQLLAATEVEDAAAVPAGVLPVRTRLSELPLAEGAADVLVFDGRGRLEDRAAAWARSLALLAPYGRCFAFGISAQAAQREDWADVKSLPLGDRVLLFGDRKPAPLRRTPAECLEAARQHLAEMLRSGCAGQQSFGELAKAARAYTELLREHRRHVLRPDERYHAAVLYERLLDAALGQAMEGFPEWLAKEADRLRGPCHIR